MNRRKTYIWWACMGSLLFGFFVLMLVKGFTPTPAAGFESRDHGAYELVSERIDAYDSSNWMILTVDENEDVGRSPSLKIDSVGRPHISYYDMDSNALKYAYWSGSSWVVDQIETFNYLPLGSDNSLALNKDDQPQISYVEGSLGDLKYAHLSGSTWVSETVDHKSSFATGSANSLTLDDSDRPHIAYNDQANQDVMYAKWDSGSWILERVEPDARVPFGISIALDSKNQPHIIYTENYPTSLVYANWNGSSWESITLDDNFGWFSSNSSLALEGNDNAHVTYYDESGGDLKYVHWNGTDWVRKTVDSVGDVGDFSSLVLDSAGFAHISYYDVGKDDLKYAHWTGTEWSIQVVDSNGDVGAGTSISLGWDERPRIAYYDVANGDLKMAFLEPGISGQVSDIRGKPLSGVTIMTGAGLSATTTATGVYSITVLSKGAYKLTPQLTGYWFAPATQVVHIPPDALDTDFVGSTTPFLYTYLPLVQDN